MSLVRRTAGEELIDLLDRVLDKGIVVDAGNRLNLIAANLVKGRKHVVIASVEVHLQRSEARAITRSKRLQPTSSASKGPQLLLGTQRHP